MIEYKMTIPELGDLRSRWADLPARLKVAVRTTLMKSAIIVQAAAREEAPVKTGRMRSAIRIIPVGDTKAIIDASANYSGYVERGTGIYGKYRTPIVRPNGGIMWTKSDPGFGQPNARGYWFLGKSVKGQQANPFMRRAFDRTRPLVNAEFKTMITEFTKEL